MAEPSHAELLETYDYCPETGVFTWKVDRRYLKLIGKRAGWKNPTGYHAIRFGKRNLPLHRVAWYYVHGVWPRGELDHINCDKSDNRIENLRECTRTQNSWNLPVFKSSTTGFKGVQRQQSGRYAAKIRNSKKPVYLGTYDTAEEAAAAYTRAAKAMRGEFARGSA